MNVITSHEYHVPILCPSPSVKFSYVSLLLSILDALFSSVYRGLIYTPVSSFSVSHVSSTGKVSALLFYFPRDLIFFTSLPLSRP
jgi:hypothetical protein